MHKKEFLIFVWNVIIVLECELKKERFAETMNAVVDEIRILGNPNNE